MRNNKTIYENPIIYFLIIIIAIGITMLYSASSTIAFDGFNEYTFYLNKHLIRLLLGITAFIIMYNVMH